MAELSRRTFVVRGLQLPAAGVALWAITACAQKDKSTACVDTTRLTPAEAQLRQSYHYVEQSTDPAKTCNGCAFFTPADEGNGCGKCSVMTGPANPLGHCDSWAAKPA